MCGLDITEVNKCSRRECGKWPQLLFPPKPLVLEAQAGRVSAPRALDIGSLAFHGGSLLGERAKASAAAKGSGQRKKGEKLPGEPASPGRANERGGEGKVRRGVGGLEASACGGERGREGPKRRFARRLEQLLLLSGRAAAAAAFAGAFFASAGRTFPFLPSGAPSARGLLLPSVPASLLAFPRLSPPPAFLLLPLPRLPRGRSPLPLPPPPPLIVWRSGLPSFRAGGKLWARGRSLFQRRLLLLLPLRAPRRGASAPWWSSPKWERAEPVPAPLTDRAADFIRGVAAAAAAAQLSQMCDLLDSQPAATAEKKLSRMKKLRRTLSESFGRIGEPAGEWSGGSGRKVPAPARGVPGRSGAEHSFNAKPPSEESLRSWLSFGSLTPENLGGETGNTRF